MMYNNELYHYGIKRRSGRYPYGSGERPFQGLSDRRKAKAEIRKKKNIEIGTERLSNRIKRANKLADVDQLSKKIGWRNTVRAGEAHKRSKDIKESAREIMADEKRVESLGRYTKNARRGIAAATLTSMVAVGGIGTAYLASAGLAALPLGASVGLYMIGDKWMKKTFY